jgi:hypothetical protein
MAYGPRSATAQPRRLGQRGRALPTGTTCGISEAQQELAEATRSTATPPRLCLGKR